MAHSGWLEPSASRLNCRQAAVKRHRLRTWPTTYALKATPSPAALEAITISRGGYLATTSFRISAGSSLIRSEEHTSELQSLTNLVCRLLLEKKKNKKKQQHKH